MNCELEQDDKAFPGTTLYTNPKGHCIKQTAVYFPPNHGKGAKLDVILWIHGFYVDDHKYLFRSDPTRLREQVMNSRKNVVLIAPHLGHEYTKDKKFVGDYNVRDMATAKWGERYLNQILAAIAQVPEAGCRSSASARDRQAHHRVPFGRRRWNAKYRQDPRQISIEPDRVLGI